MLKQLERRLSRLQRGSGLQKYHLRLNNGSYLDITIREIIKTFFDAIDLINIIEFNETKPDNFEELFQKVKTLANVADSELKESEPELAMSVWHCKKAIDAQPLTLEEMREIDRSLCPSEECADALESRGLLDYQRRKAI